MIVQKLPMARQDYPRATHTGFGAFGKSAAICVDDRILRKQDDTAAPEGCEAKLLHKISQQPFYNQDV